MSTSNAAAEAPPLTLTALRQALELTVAGFGSQPATQENAGARAQIFVAALSGMVAIYDRQLGDAIYSIVQPPMAPATSPAPEAA
ncbi:hypothetical protein ACLB1G_21760 [Oxalobacteraceae bacterium A2-2]